MEEHLSSKQILFIHYASALAVQQTLKKLAEINIQIKWPNDIHILDKKLGGILIEYISGDKLFLLIGIGINLNTRIIDIDSAYRESSTSLLIETNQTIETNDLISILSENLLDISSEIIMNNYTNTIKHFNSNSLLFEREIKLVNGKEFMNKGIDEDGKLHLENKEEKLFLTIEDSKMILGMI